MQLIDIGANLTHDSFDRAAIALERESKATRRSAPGSFARGDGPRAP